MAVALHDIQSIQQFDSKDTSGINVRWKRWFRAFELYAEGKDVSDPDQKKVTAFHSAAMDVQDVFFTFKLPNGEVDNAYAKAKDGLTKYFSPLSNVPFERHKFRTTVQGQGESVEQYIMRV